MGFSIIFLLLGLAAVFAVTGDSSGDLSDEADPTPPEDDDDASPINPSPDEDDLAPEEQELERIRLTGQGNDNPNLIVASADLMVYSGLGGNDTMVGSPDSAVMLLAGDGDDTLLAFDADIARGGGGNDLLLGEHTGQMQGPQSLNGGPGNDTIITHGGSDVTGGEGQDLFILSPMGIDPVTGAFQSTANTALSVPVITDFNAEDDVLVVDLVQSFDGFAQAQAGSSLDYDDQRTAPEFGETVLISVLTQPDGLILLVNDTPFAFVQGLTPDQLTQEGVLQVNGADYTFAPALEAA